MFLAFYLVSEKSKKKNLQIRANQISCKLIGMRAFFFKIIFRFKESRAKVPHKLKNHVMGATSTALTPRLSI